MVYSLTIIAHGGAEETFQRHRPLWDALGCADILVVSPENDPVKDCPYPQVSSFQAHHSGRWAYCRMRFVLDTLVKKGYEHNLICEYDSFLLAKDLSFTSGLLGILQPNLEPCRFMAARYPNPPWMIDRKSLLLMQSAAEKWPAVREEGFADRCLAAWADLAGVPILPFDPPGFTKGTIERVDWEELKLAIKHGATIFHGVKDVATLDLIRYELGKQNDQHKQAS